jgi:hypothetical protein
MKIELIIKLNNEMIKDITNNYDDESIFIDEERLNDLFMKSKYSNDDFGFFDMINSINSEII